MLGRAVPFRSSDERGLCAGRIANSRSTKRLTAPMISSPFTSLYNLDTQARIPKLTPHTVRSSAPTSKSPLSTSTRPVSTPGIPTTCPSTSLGWTRSSRRPGDATCSSRLMSTRESPRPSEFLDFAFYVSRFGWDDGEAEEEEEEKSRVESEKGNCRRCGTGGAGGGRLRLQRGRRTGRLEARGVIMNRDQQRRSLFKLNLIAMATHSRTSVPSFVCSGSRSSSALAHRDPYAGAIGCEDS